MAAGAPPPPSGSGKGAQAQKQPPPPPSKKKIRPPTRKPAEKPKLPPLKKKGKGKIWAGLIGIILGIILIIALQGMSFLPFIGVLVILIAVYLLYKGLTDVDKVLVPEKITVGAKTKTKMVYKPKKTLNKGAIFIFIVFIFFALPIFLTLFQFGNVSDQPYSVYNTGDGGCSKFRENIEGMGYETSAVISSYAELTKFPDDYPLNRTVLFVIGPKSLFFPTDLFHLQALLDAGGKLVILQDMGTANEGLMFLGIFDFLGAILGSIPSGYANMFDLPFQDGYLCDGPGGTDSAAIDVTLTIAGGSYNVRFWTVSPIAGGTSFYSTVDFTAASVWLDLNKNFNQDPEDVTAGGGYAVTASNGNIVLISDPDILTNLLINDVGVDNSDFANELVKSMTGGGIDTSWKILFDEAHQVKQGYSGAFYFGTIIAIEDFLLLSWLFAPLGPYLAFRITKKFIPKAEKPEKVKLSRVKREGESLYTKRLNWFKRRRRYEKALALLYRRLKRSLTKTLNVKGFDKEEVIGIILNNYPEGDVDEKRVVKAFENFEEVEKGRRVPYQEEFMKIFLEMQWISDLAAPRQ